MHIAVLATNTDTSAFAARHPDDGHKFRALIHGMRPDWRISIFDLPAGDFPDVLADYDGFVIGGSPASVNDDAPWIGRLLRLIPAIVAQNRPLFGACFGHQAIAVALGGTVAPNPGGWVFGVTETTPTATAAPWMQGDLRPIRVNAAHSEQVTALPPGAEVISTNSDCAVGAMRIGPFVFTTQYHPEMTADFIAALVEDYADDLPEPVAAQARRSLGQPADSYRMAAWIVGFLEQGQVTTARPTGPSR